jgi:S-adenosylmethionine:tRNA ribosyltransferase-isomerase
MSSTSGTEQARPTGGPDTTVPLPAFAIPDGAEAAGPPEERNLRRDQVRLLVARPGSVAHRRFSDVVDELEPGDLVVVNTSATLPAAVDVRWEDGTPAVVHLSGVRSPTDWLVEVRLPDGSGPDRRHARGDNLLLPDGVELTLGAGYPDPAALSPRLRRAVVHPATDATSYLPRVGRPIGYSYLRGRHPLAAFQTVYAREPGSAEMASAGRPFTTELLVSLMARGVTVAPVVLHAGVSSPEAGEPPLPEWFRVPADTARLVRSARHAGRRIVAVGTTVVRALESAADPVGTVRATSGETDLVLGPAHPARVVTGLVTGLHAPEASHLRLLQAVAGVELVEQAYAAAVERRYLWHEFGDSTLFLPSRPGTAAVTSTRTRRGTPGSL